MARVKFAETSKTGCKKKGKISVKETKLKGSTYRRQHCRAKKGEGTKVVRGGIYTDTERQAVISRAWDFHDPNKEGSWPKALSKA